MRRPAAWPSLFALAALPWAFQVPAALAQPYSRPVTCDTCISDFYYVDETGNGPGAQDWNCGSSTYDGHLGSDFSLRNGNFAIDTGYDVVAMADGMVVHTEDGYYDRCTQCGGANCGYDFGNGFANQVKIDHGTYTVVYGHMRTGSLAVAMGDQVKCGQVIGQIGSSGCSTGAHLHVEPVGDDRLSYDPFKGNCSNTDPSMWAEQNSYRSLPGVSCETTGGTPTCPADTYPIWTCNTALTSRRRCVAGEDMVEECAYGCVGMPAGSDDVCGTPPDEDHDGAGADVDCNDMDPRLYPGAMDVCGDGLDQDCSGEDAPCPATDADADGSGAMLDCNDNDPSIHPAASEVCGDGVDQDCDGADLACGPTVGGPNTPPGGPVPPAMGGQMDAPGQAGAPGGTPTAGDPGPIDSHSPTRVDRADDGGCGCRLATPGSPRVAWLAALACLVGVRLRRVRRRA